MQSSDCDLLLPSDTYYLTWGFLNSFPQDFLRVPRTFLNSPRGNLNDFFVFVDYKSRYYYPCLYCARTRFWPLLLDTIFFRTFHDLRFPPKVPSIAPVTPPGKRSGKTDTANCCPWPALSPDTLTFLIHCIFLIKISGPPTSLPCSPSAPHGVAPVVAPTGSRLPEEALSGVPVGQR